MTLLRLSCVLAFVLLLTSCTRQPAVREPAASEPTVSKPAASEPAASAPAVSEPAVRYGFAHVSDDVTCAALSGDALKEGAPVVVVSGEDRGRQGAVQRVLQSCEAFAAAGTPGPYYAIKFTSPVQPGVLLVSTGNTPRNEVTECSSTEGVHYNVWSGEARKSDRLWHGYWYAGYDLEPNCSEAEIGDVGT